MASTQTQSGAMSVRSARSARSARSSRSGRTTGASEASDGGGSTRASSVSTARSGESFEPPPSPVMAPESPEPDEGMDHQMETGPMEADDDMDDLGLDAQSAQYINLVHMDQMLQYVRSAEAQDGLDTLLEIVKRRDGGPEAIGYRSALTELDYLEGLFKKLRFSYKEQLTKETVVRRILEIELPLLSAADIEAMVQDTEVERQRLREIKNVAREQGAAAEAIIRGLSDERQSVAEAEADLVTLPERLRHLRHRLVRMKLALRSELQGMEASAVAESTRQETVTQAPPLSKAFSCRQCSRSFHTEAFQALHVALHSAPAANTRSVEENWDDWANWSDPEAFPMQSCRACPEPVPKLFANNAPPGGESHTAFHARVRAEVDRAAMVLMRMVPAGEELAGLEEFGDLGDDDDLDSDEMLMQLQLDDDAAAEAEAQAREEAEAQATAEEEMGGSVDSLRLAVGAIRLEMMRIEQEAAHMAQHIGKGKAAEGGSFCANGSGGGSGSGSGGGRALQEQVELFSVLGLNGDRMDE